MKKIVASLSLGLAVALMSGCGGGGGSSTPSTGTGYYIDSAVEGVAYKCGTQEGNTTNKGAFTFDVGAGCEFYLGDMKLKTIDKSKLKDGVKIQETDVKIARVLIAVDSDGNPSNGITVDMDLVKKALEDKNFSTLPTDDTAYNELLTALANAGAPYISGQDATKHLFGNLLAGKTFYTQEIGNSLKVAKYTFNEDLTTLKVKDSKGERDLHIYLNDEGELNIPIYSENNYANLVIGDVTDDYIELKDEHRNGEATIFKLFSDKSKAEKEYVKTPLPLTAEMLNGMTIYVTDENDNGKEKYIKATFSIDTVSIVEMDKNSGSKDNFTMGYSVENNVIYFKEEDENKENEDAGMALIEKNSNTWTFIQLDDGEKEIWYLSKPADFPADL